MNKKRFYIISSTLLLIGLFAGVVQYIGVIDTIYAAINNPGHSWSEMECSTALCIDTTNNRVGVGTMNPTQTLEINGNIKLGGENPTYTISNISRPINDSDVATKKYVDALLLWPLEGCALGEGLVMGTDGPVCDALLSWPESTKRVKDCFALGGDVYDTGSGTICKYSGATVPAGWTQAQHWQRYSSATWGGDACGNHKSTGPDTFSNQAANAFTYDSSSIAWWPNPCATHPGWWWTAFTGYNGHPVVADSLTTSNNRVEIGIY